MEIKTKMTVKEELDFFLFCPSTSRAAHVTISKGADGDSWQLEKTEKRLKGRHEKRRDLRRQAAEGSIKGNPLRC